MDDSTSSGRSIDIELGGQEVITIDLDNLDPNPEDVLDLLKDGQCTIWVWTKLAGEYWRRGYLPAAEKIALTAIESFRANGAAASLPPMYSLLANIQIANARKAPKLILADARQDIMIGEKSKEEYYREAAQYLNAGEREVTDAGEGQLATRSMDDALRSFDGVLAEKPTNVVALLGKARILYARRSYREALKLFQDVLRIGIGLCLWALDHKAKAKLAWQRSLELNPSEWSVQLLLGLEAINASKNENITEAERTHSFLSAFNANQKSAAAANALCELFLQKGNHKRALKLAERTVQFADTLTILTEGSHVHATKYFSTATEGQPKHTLGAIGLAQMQMHNDEMAAAIHTLDTLIQPPNPQRSLQATVMLASLRAHPRPGERSKARDLFDRVIKSIEIDEARLNSIGPSENLDRVNKALREALRISEATGQANPRVYNNLGALQQLEGNLQDARSFYEKSLIGASGLGPESGESISTSILYNLARVYEEQGEEVMAKDAYEKLVSRHPEYVDAKIRQAQMLANLNRPNEAHELLKQCLASQNSNLNVRAFYTYFLIQTNLPKLAKDFVFATLKEHDKHDVYALCAAGWIQYYQSRESRDTSTKGIEERKRGFQRTAEFYEKALQLDPLCSFAAQGLAIITAEDALGTLSGGPPPTSGADEAHRRLKNARDALDVFAKVRESMNDGSVYLNMGHCHYYRDEFDRAIESYETASTRFYNGHNISILLCLCRSWYSKATKDHSFVAMNTALKYAQMAFHLQPNDKATTYNIAMIQQKSAEMLFAIPPAKRSLKDLQKVIDQASHAQKLFASLAADKSQMVPYNRDIADQRRKYGDNMLRKAEEHLTTQRQFEAESQAKLDAARRKRQEEKEQQEEKERVRMNELRIESEKLAEERRLAREQAMEWTREVRMESDEERERKVKKTRKPKTEGGSGDEAEPKKKRRGKLKKASSQGDLEDQATISEEEEEKPTKKRSVKKRVVRDEDEEETAGPRKKQFKSKAMLSDTDDEMS
ncbi:RNA polymerase II-associated protein [Infundibulicybe gibba]|nr:RNA polymerase II-associated protein [Infundibulicybe gibba]